MIPRVRPSYAWSDFRAAFFAKNNAVVAFEQELAAHFGLKHAIAFPYGRSALYAALKALNRPAGEVLQPAYNCVVVAHATVCAGYRPVFVDTQPNDPNQNPEAMLQQVNRNTAVVIPTSIFGVPFDASTLFREIRNRNPEALVIVDYCQAFDATWPGTAIQEQGDAVLLAFGIGKPMTTLFGGALLTDREDIHKTVRGYRDATFQTPSRTQIIGRWGYFLASWIALSDRMVGFTDWMEHAETPLRRYLLSLRSRESIVLPADNTTLMMSTEAGIGRSQLRRVGQFLNRRREIAQRYADGLQGLPDLELLCWPNGSSYAIYAVRVRHAEDRTRILTALRRKGIQGDTVLNYVVPALGCYAQLGYSGEAYPHAADWSARIINFPNHPTMTDAQVTHVIHALRSALGAGQG